MSITTLKLLRLLVPGLLILFALLPLQNQDLKSLSETIKAIKISKESFTFYVIPLALGAVYYALGLRNIFFRKPIIQIRANIRHRLVKPFSQNPEIEPYAERLRQNTKVKELFYKFVDENPSLREKSNLVRTNGLILSSLADCCVVSLFAFVLYLVFFLVSPSGYYLLLLGLTLSLLLFCRLVLLPRTLQLHIGYSDSQIDFILANLREDLRKALITLAENEYGK